METLPSRQVDGQVWKEIQARYGEKPKEQRRVHKQLDKDDFLKIMVTQLQHQDPTSPMDADKLAAQIAQMTSVEQLQNVNTALKKMTENNRPIERMNMTNMIGKIATVDENRFAHVQGKNDLVEFKLPEDIAKGNLQIISDKGEMVLEKDLGSLKSGVNSFVCDGKKSNTTDALNGNYTVRIEAENEKGAPVQISTMAKTRIIGVSFEGADPVFIVGDAKQQKRITFDSIISVETGDQGPREASASQQPQLGMIGANPTSKFFSFEKGKGSTPMAATELDPKTQELLEKYKAPEMQRMEPPAHRGHPAAHVAGQPAMSRGFPNGLGENKE